MTGQLLLLDDSGSEWRIPEGTKQLGRRGIAEARAILHSIPRRFDATHEVAAPTPLSQRAAQPSDLAA